MPEMVCRVTTCGDVSVLEGLREMSREGTYAFLGDGGTVSTQYEPLCGGREFGETGDGEVFVVEVWVLSESLVGLGRPLSNTDSTSER